MNKVIIHTHGTDSTKLQHLLNRMRKSKFNRYLNTDSSKRITRIYSNNIPKDKVDSIASYCQSIGCGLAVIIR